MNLSDDQVQYTELLLKNLETQSQLLKYRFDWKNRKFIPPAQSGFFRRKYVYEKGYMQALDKLEQLKAQLWEICVKNNTGNKYYWWNTPWQLVESGILYHLAEETEKDSWRFEYHWESIKQGDRFHLFLREEGHCSQFISSDYEYRREKSNYTEEEQKELIDQFNRKLDKKRKWDCILDDGSLVKSDIGNIYASMYDYYDSWEYRTDRSYANDIYAKSMKYVHHSRIKEVVSQSIHYECVFEYGEIHVDQNNMVDGLRWYPFEFQAGDGSLPTGIQDKYKETKDSALAVAAFIQKNPLFQGIPVSVLGPCFTGGCSSETEAARFSAIFTCLAGKIVSE